MAPSMRSPTAMSTGNDFGTELGVLHDLEAAVQALCPSFNVRRIDIAQYNEDFYFIQRLFTGIEPDEQQR